jgi:N-acetylmuramoyl-L-alanine amidase
VKKARFATAPAAAAVLALALAGTVHTDADDSPAAAALVSRQPGVQHVVDGGATTGEATLGEPLRGKVVVIDPGHQLGNSRHLRQINQLVNAGGFKKACNTTGTSTDSGFPEATFAWRVSRLLKAQLKDRGATVYLTRRTNSYADWGPCIDDRGRKGNRVEADAVVSIHGDGASPGVRGFFVIRPGLRRGWTGDIVKTSRAFAVKVRHGLTSAGARVSNSYGGDGYDVRTDLGTLNWSNVPIVMVELGNMRNGVDARHMTSPHYRGHVYAHGLRSGVVSYLRR